MRVYYFASVDPDTKNPIPIAVLSDSEVNARIQVESFGLTDIEICGSEEYIPEELEEV